MSDAVDPATNLHLIALDRALDLYTNTLGWPGTRQVLETADAFRGYVEYGTIPDAE